MGTNELLGYHALLKRGTAEQKQKYLPRLATGEMMATWCLAEEMAGSDPDGVRSVAVEDGEGFVISGTKTWVTNAQGAQNVVFSGCGRRGNLRTYKCQFQ